MAYDQRHGGPFDRGSADAYYWRPARPHYFVGDTYSSDEVIPKEGSSEYEAYMAGFNTTYERKDWN
jgi:hypothetical protein